MTQTEFDAILAKITDADWRKQVYNVWQDWTPEERAATTAERLYVDVADTILGFQAETRGVARPVSELIAADIPRDHMTEEEERAFVNHWFNEYERTGFAKTFDTPYTSEKKYKGQTFEVLGRCAEDDKHDLEVLPTWRIRLESGVEIEALPEEICNLEREQSKSSQSAANTIRFDPKDWDSIRETLEQVQERGCVQSGTTEHDEVIFFDVTRDYKLHTTVLQKNGWERHNYYDISDCSVEELYKKGDREVEEPARPVSEEKKLTSEKVVLRAHKATMETRYGVDHAVVYDDPSSPKYANEEQAKTALMDELGYEPSDDPNSEYPGYYEDDVGAYFEYTGHEDIVLPASLVSDIRKPLEEKLLLSEANARHFKEERDALQTELQALKDSKAQSPETRIVETPGGQIVAYPKHDVDSPEDYPGIYVDLILPNKEKLMLACVEYDSCAKELYCCVYGNALDDSPTHTRHYENIKELQAQCRKPTIDEAIKRASEQDGSSSAPVKPKDKTR